MLYLNSKVDLNSAGSGSGTCLICELTTDWQSVFGVAESSRWDRFLMGMFELKDFCE